MTEREEFEAWADTQSNGRLRSSYTGDYDYPLGRHMFAAWQAARRADEALLRDAVEALEHARAAISGMKTEAETAGAGGDEQMLQDAAETISNDGLEAETALYTFIARLRPRLEGTTS